jgi:glycosyltransferase involved in cell wall biosynthesis
LRVLFVAQFDFTGPTEKQFAGFARELLRRGHTVMFSLGGEPGTEAGEGVAPDGDLRLRVHRFEGGRLRAEDALAARRFAPAVVHALLPRLPAIRATAQIAAVTAAPVCVHFEDDEWHVLDHLRGESPYHWAGAAWRRLRSRSEPNVWPHATRGSLRWVRRNAAALDALTPVLAAEVEHRLRRPCATLMPAAPSSDTDPASQVELPAAIARRPIAMVTGSIYPSYLRDFMLGLRAVAEVQRRGHDLAYVHAGRVHPRMDPDRLAADAGLEPGSWLFTGLVPYPSVPGLLRQASVLLQPGTPTNFNRLRLPARLQPYLESGTPTITCAIGSGELLEDRREVLKTHTDDPGELADRIVEVFASADLRARLSAGGPAAARRLFDPVATTDALEEHYRAVLRAPAPQAGLAVA